MKYFYSEEEWDEFGFGGNYSGSPTYLEESEIEDLFESTLKELKTLEFGSEKFKEKLEEFCNSLNTEEVVIHQEAHGPTYFTFNLEIFKDEKDKFSIFESMFNSFKEECIENKAYDSYNKCFRLHVKK